MATSTTIRLAGARYSITSKAKPQLQAYLDSWREAADADTAKETVSDVEHRIVEILQDRGITSTNQQSITHADITAIYEEVGNPDSFTNDNNTTSIVKSRVTGRLVWTTAAVIVLLIVLFCVVLSGVGWLADNHSKIVTKTQTYHQAIAELDVSVGTGSITVKASTNNEVSVTHTAKWLSQKPTLKEVWQGNKLDIDTSCFALFNVCSTDYIIYVPASTTVVAKVSSGNIRAEGLTGSTSLAASSGKIHARGLDGDVTVQGSSTDIIGESLRAAHLKATSASGKINLQFATAPNKVEAHLSSGDVMVSVPRDDAYHVETHTDVGDKNIGIRQSDVTGRAIIVTTNSGNISINYAQ